MTWRRIPALLLLCVACTEPEPDLELEVLFAEAEATPPEPLDPTAGFVTVDGVVETAVVDLTPDPTHDAGTPDRDGQPPWILARMACDDASPAAIRAVLDDPRGAAVLRGMRLCDAPAWCQVGAEALVTRSGQPQVDLADGLASCRGPAIDAVYRGNPMRPRAIDVRLRALPDARINAESSVLAGVIQAQLSAEPDRLPRVVEALVAGGHERAVTEVLIEAWESTPYDQGRAAIGRSMAFLSDVAARQAHNDTCRDWASRDFAECADVQLTAMVPGPTLPSLLPEAAVQAGFHLRLARYDREWPRGGAALSDALFDCVTTDTSGLPPSTVFHSDAAACLLALMRRDRARATQAAERFANPTTNSQLLARLAAARHADNAALVAWLVGAELLPTHADPSALGPEATAVDWLTAYGRAVDPWELSVHGRGDAHAQLLLALFGLAGVHVDHVEVDETVVVPDGRGRVAVRVWTGGERISATLRPEDPSYTGRVPDFAGAVALVNAVLARAGSPRRLFANRQRSTIVVGSPDALASLVGAGHLVGTQLTPLDAAHWASEPTAEADTGW